MASAGNLGFYIENFVLPRRRLVELMLDEGGPRNIEVEILRVSNLLAPIIATCGPAGPNAAPFMVSFLVREEYLEDVIEELRMFRRKYWGAGHRARMEAAKLLLRTVYDESKIDPLRLVTHMMSKGHTWINVKATGEVTLAVLLPPDRGALEVRAKATIYEEGPIYEYTNLLHDLMHGVPEGETAHPWYPAMLMEVMEIYDNSYQKLGQKIYSRDQPA